MARFLPAFLPCYLAFDHVHVLVVIKREFHLAKRAHVPKRTFHATIERRHRRSRTVGASRSRVGRAGAA